MIGGTSIEEERHQRIEEAPQYWKYVTLPFAIVAAPFVYVYERVAGEPEPGPEVPDLSATRGASATPPGPAPTDYETRQLEAMERELAERAGAAPPPPLSPTPSRARPPAPGARPSIAEELARLRAEGNRESRTGAATLPEQSRQPSQPRQPNPPRPASDPLASASGHVDRNGDGNTDHWIFREQGEISRELFDEDFDGHPDRTLHYDLATHRVARIEEDGNRDGRADTFTSLREGRVVGRRADSDDDGQIDTWTFYRDGSVTRVERDANGNGFRDHVAHYRGGKLSHEERDEDGDGIADLITHYDAQQNVLRVEEDANGDGQLDVVSHYKGGRLTSRELLDSSLLPRSAPEPQEGTR